MVLEPVVSPLLVGREDEVHELVERRLASSKGRGALLLVSGDTGVGKSRLIQSFRDELAGRKTKFGVGYCRPTGNAPYAPFIEAARGIGLPLSIPQASSRPEQFALIAEAIGAACRRRNAVIVLEDIHAADDATLSLLVHFLPSIRLLPLLLVATYRAGEVRRAPATIHLAALQRHCSSEIALEPLSPAEMRQLLRSASPVQYKLTADEIDEIVARAEGNPFFALELLKSLPYTRRSGRPPQLPPTIRAAVQERLLEADEQTLTVIRCASIFGRYVESALLAQICETSGTAVLSALRQLCELQVLERVSSMDDAFAFKHVLIREVIYDSMLPQQARPLHARMLSLLERRPVSSAPDLAYHAWAAGDAERCTFYNEHAGDEASALHAYSDAVHCYDRALQTASDRAVRLRLLGKAAESCARDGKAQRAANLYAKAADESQALGDTSGWIERQAAAAVQLRHAGHNERAQAILSRALGEARDANPRLRAELSLHLAFCHVDHAEIAHAQRLIATSADAAPPTFYWRACCYAAAVAGNLEAMRTASAQEIDASRALGEIAVLQARFNFAFHLGALGIDDEALAAFDALLPKLRALHLSSLEMLSLANAALIDTRRGDLAGASERIREALLIPEPSTTGPIALAAAALTLANYTADEALVRSAVSEQVVAAAFASNIDSTLGRIAGPYARWLHSNRREDEARVILVRAVRRLHGLFGTTETLIAAAELGDDETADRALELAARRPEAQVLPIYAATLAHLRVLRALRRVDGEGTGYAFEAERAYAELQWPIHAARCAEFRGKSIASTTYRRPHARGELRRKAVLSPREREIALLVEEGLSNKLLASRLELSLRSIEKRLTSIYSKLGLRNRAQLVAFMARLPREP